VSYKRSIFASSFLHVQGNFRPPCPVCSYSSNAHPARGFPPFFLFRFCCLIPLSPQALVCVIIVDPRQDALRSLGTLSRVLSSPSLPTPTPMSSVTWITSDFSAIETVVSPYAAYLLLKFVECFLTIFTRHFLPSERVPLDRAPFATPVPAHRPIFVIPRSLTCVFLRSIHLDLRPTLRAGQPSTPSTIKIVFPQKSLCISSSLLLGTVCLSVKTLGDCRGSLLSEPPFLIGDCLAHSA